MKVLAVDIDGVVSKFPRIYQFRLLETFFNVLLFFPPVKYLYLKRGINIRVREWLIERVKRGYIIVIVSGAWEMHRATIEKFLKRQKIPFHYLVLSYPFYFHSLVLKRETRWDLLIEDNPRIVSYLSKHLKIKVRQIGNIYLVKRSQ